jgi:hypothetical protein
MRQTIVRSVGAIDAHSAAIAPSSNPLADQSLAKVVQQRVLEQVLEQALEPALVPA